MSQEDHRGQSGVPGAFEISWHDDFGYRVSVPNLLEESERLKVVPLSEYQAVIDALDALYGSLPRWSCKSTEPDGCPVCMARALLVAANRKEA